MHKTLERVVSRRLLVPALILAWAITGCGGGEAPPEGAAETSATAGDGAAGQELVIYSGRSKGLVEPLVERFQDETGISVRVRYGDTSQLAVALLEERDQSAADLFWAQDAGALGAVSKAGLLAALPEELLKKVAPSFRGPEGRWVATSGRARVLAYSAERVNAEDVPRSVFDLTSPAFAGRVGWAPQNASFQSFVTAMRVSAGEEKTLAWLTGMKDNGAKAYPKNSPILEAIAAGEIDFGLPNHYYLLRFKAKNPDFPVAQTLFAAGDPGNLVNVAGVGVLDHAAHPEAAERFVAFLLSEPAQRTVVEDIYEYPVIHGVHPAPSLPSEDELESAALPVNLDQLRDLEGTLALMRRAGIL